MEKTTIINKLEKILENYHKYDEDRKKNELNEIIKELKLDVIGTHKVGKFNVNNYFKKFLKDEFRTPLKNSFKQKNGKYAVCDGFKMIEFLDENDEIAKSLYKENNVEIEYDKVISKRGQKVNIDTAFLDKILNYNKVNKLKDSSAIPYVDKFEDGKYWAVNSQWLKDLLQLNNTNEVTLGTDKNAPIEITSEKYRSLVLPIRMYDCQGFATEKLDYILNIYKELKEEEEM